MNKKIKKSPSLDKRWIISPAILLFVSGLAALVYQVLWIKQLSIVVGVDVHAVSTAVSAFFAGLALGSYIFGRRADRLSHPLRLYAMLEIGVAILGVIVTFALGRSAALFAQLQLMAGPLAWLLPFLLVAAPAFLMGGTLPVLVRSISPNKDQLGYAGGLLYAANTAGAIAGALLTSFVLIPAFGVFGSSVFAAILNLAAGVGAFLLVGKDLPASTKSKTAADPAGKSLALWLYAIAGGLALGYEVIWSQAVVQWTSTRTFAFSVVLATYLLGLVLGSAFFSRRADRTKDSWGVFGFLIAAAGVTALLALAFSGDVLTNFQESAGDFAFKMLPYEGFARAARFFVVAGWLVLIPTMLLGAAFPAALRLIVDPANSGRDTGRIVAFNTVGGIVGTLVIGFVLVPFLGIERSLGLLAFAAVGIGLVAVWKGHGVTKVSRNAIFACAGIAILGVVLLPSDHLVKLLAKGHGGKLIFHEPSAAGTVAVVEQRSAEKSFRRLYISGVSNSGNSMTSQRYMRLQALLPLIISKEEPKSALVIGLGTGITAGSLLYYPGLDKRVCAELLPAVVRAASLFEGNNNVTEDSRVDIRLRDGRSELLRSKEQYDLITLEPPPPSAAGVVNLYSSDFYQLAADRLNPNGLVAQWLPLPTQTNEDTRSLVRSFLDVYPYASVWSTELHEMLLIGSNEPLELDVDKISERFNQPEVSAAMREVGINTTAELLATWITDRDGLEAYAGDALPTTDNQPRIEYGDWVVPGEFTHALVALNDEYRAPQLLHADPALLEEIELKREILLRFYEAGIYAYEGDAKNWAIAMKWVKQRAPENPYYLWFMASEFED
ncbi:fused MFS/spermidine synthase [Algoriphagus chordae]|uniref:Putative membrane-bound spermidine synthase n=1 Tax=Algoriphagus chordae TaxID=237019 RepID=A0A2W7SD28_9BACT|nr:fused MFS/spermidine synthase [Algoriphagus chordae]PZX48532.1 putative membrane-bound spermidine synthase [Algoriphagus chordae]